MLRVRPSSASRGGLAALVTCSLALASCGGGASLPEAAPCPTPTVATTTPTSSSQQAGRYFNAVRSQSKILGDRLAAFRASYPERQFYSRDSFRPDFVEYHGTASCAVSALSSIQVPPTASEETKAFDANLKALMRDYATELEKGREAVRGRNATDYRRFYRQVDALQVRLTELVPPR